MAYALGRSAVAEAAKASMSYTRIGMIKGTAAAGFAVVEMAMGLRVSPVNASQVIPLRKADPGASTIGIKADFRDIATGLEACLGK
jgi:hypothetical protein